MTLILNLPPEQETELRERALKHGKAVDEYALSLLNRALKEPVPEAKPRPFYETATPDEWVKAWHDWTHSHDPNGPVLLDDRREVIYED